MIKYDKAKAYKVIMNNLLIMNCKECNKEMEYNKDLDLWVCLSCGLETHIQDSVQQNAEQIKQELENRNHAVREKLRSNV